MTNSQSEPVCTDVYCIDFGKEKERLNLHWNLHRVYEIIRHNYTSNHRISGLFSHLLKPHEDHYVAPMDKLQLLLAELAALPKEEQRRAFNGWQPNLDCLSMEEVRELVIYPPVQQQPASAYIEWHNCSDEDPVHIHIRQGSHRVDVIRYLARMLDFIRMQWDEMIVAEEGIDERCEATPLQKEEV